MPPYFTPGDGRFVRQGTSLLYIAGEKTKASAPWGYTTNHVGGFFCWAFRFALGSKSILYAVKSCLWQHTTEGGEWLMSENIKPETREQTGKKRKRKHRIRRWIALAVVLAVAGIIGYLAVRKLQRDYTVTYDAYTTSIGTISNSLNYSGSMQLINSATYTADETVKVREVYVSAGDKVSKGNRLMRLSNGTTLTAEFDGTVNIVGAEKGDEVAKDTTLVQVADFGSMQVSFRIGESDISQVSVGQNVRVTVASADATFESEIKSIDYASYTGNSVAYYTAVVDVDTSETADIYPGMQATVTIPREEVADVVILKMDAISTAMDNSAFVYIQDEDGTMKEQPITVGVSNGNYAEVKEGLSDGETVYVAAKAEESEGGLLAGLFGTQQVNMPSPGSGTRPSGGFGGSRDGSGGSSERPSGFSPNR